MGLRSGVFCVRGFSRGGFCNSGYVVGVVVVLVFAGVAIVRSSRPVDVHRLLSFVTLTLNQHTAGAYLQRFLQPA